MSFSPTTGQTSQKSLAESETAAETLVSLGRGRKGLRGKIVRVGRGEGAEASPEHDEMERRLVETGLVEGAVVEILHEGWMGGDPIAVVVDDTRVALRRREADLILIRPADGAPE